MTRAEKVGVVAELKEQFENNDHFYVADSSTLTVEKINLLRRKFFDKGLTLRVAKNTLIKKALEESSLEGYDEVYNILKGPSTLIFTEVSNLPAKLIKEFRKKHDKPEIKAAFVDSEVFVGDDQLELLANLKSKNELIADIIMLLESPAKNVVSALQSSGDTLARLLQALEERGQ